MWTKHIFKWSLRSILYEDFLKWISCFFYKIQHVSIEYDFGTRIAFQGLRLICKCKNNRQSGKSIRNSTNMVEVDIPRIIF